MLKNRNPRLQLSANAHMTVPRLRPRNVKVIKANYTNSQKFPIFSKCGDKPANKQKYCVLYHRDKGYQNEATL